MEGMQRDSNDEVSSLCFDILRLTAASFCPDQSVNAAVEFTLRIHPVEESLKGSVGVTLHFKLASIATIRLRAKGPNMICFGRLPRSYPKVAPNIIIEQPLGLSAKEVKALDSLLKSSIPPLLGSEMVYELSQIAATYITDNHLAVRFAGKQTSLIDEMATRADELERVRTLTLF
jgi:translation initiation factor 2-alpha kinase 4